ncbi:MAG: transporter substrate-binding domain-containing protein, partial [Chloroflexota bacterium]
VDAAAASAWDIAFLGSEPARERGISFSPAYLEIEATYLVQGASALEHASQVDRAGMTIAAPARANYELFLSRTLRHAQLISAPNGGAAFDLLVAGEVHALAGLKQDLLGLAGRLPASRVLDGRFMAVQQSIGLPKGHDAGLSYLRAIVEEAKASGLVARAIENTGASGVSVAPPAAA